jgi:hypothetical protein
MEFESIDEAVRFADREISPISPHSMRWYIVGPAEAMTPAALALKASMDTTLAKAVAEKVLLSYATELVDLSTSPDAIEYAHPVWQHILGGKRAGFDTPTSVYVPFFLNADSARNLGQALFDLNVPGVLCVSGFGYGRMLNHSKRETFHTLFL